MTNGGAVITYEIGDATDPNLREPFIIAHVVSTAGRFGAGFAKAVAQRYPTARARYLAWANPAQDPEIPAYSRAFILGAVQWVGVGRDLLGHHAWFDRWVVNMVAQRGLRSAANPHPLDLDALELCLRAVADGSLGRPIVMPRIGCGLAGGTWAEVEPVVERTCGDLEVHVYDLAQ